MIVRAVVRLNRPFPKKKNRPRHRFLFWVCAFGEGFFDIEEFFLQIFDASINDWRVLDEKVHTDVIEKIVEAPKKTIYVDEFVEIEKNTSISENNENITLNLNETSKHKNITENIYDEIDYVRTDKQRLGDSRTVSRLVKNINRKA